MTAYTLFEGDAHGLTTAGSGSGFTLGIQFSVSGAIPFTGIWFYSNVLATLLPTACVLWDANAGTEIAGTLNSAPTWSGAAGSGWVKCTYDGSVTLEPGTDYIASVFRVGSINWYADINGYWTSGGGSAGITNGPLSAPASSGAVNGQAVYLPSAGSIAFPADTITGYDFGVDVEVTASGVVHQTTAALTVTPAFGDSKLAGRNPVLVVTPQFKTTKKHGVNPALTVTPAFRVVSAASGPGHAAGNLAVFGGAGVF